MSRRSERRGAAALVALAILVGCGDGAPRVETPAEMDRADGEARVTALATAEERAGGPGLLSRLLGGGGGNVAAEPLAIGGPGADGAGAETAVAAGTQAAETRAAEPGRGLFARLFGGGDAAGAAPGGDAAGDGARAPSSGGPDGRDVAFGARLPYGELARVCDAPRRSLGTEIERAAGWRLHDSDPGNTRPHTFYVTGFDDGCPRQFTAALALFGAPSMHEQLRYGLPAEVQPYSETDRAYEQLKARVCRVRRNEPCGRRISRLERDTVFVSIYERFGENPVWKNLLLHDGEALALDIKGL